MGLLEMNRYIFARECYFMFVLRQTAACAAKALTFIKMVRATMEARLHSQALATTGVEDEDADASASMLYRRQLSNFWAIVASLRVVTTCTEAVRTDAEGSGGAGPGAGPGAAAAAGAGAAAASTTTTASATASRSGSPSSPHYSINSSSGSSGSSMSKHGDTAVHLGNLLEFSSSLLLSLLSVGGSDPLRGFQDKAAALVGAMKTYRSMDAILETYSESKAWTLATSTRCVCTLVCNVCLDPSDYCFCIIPCLAFNFCLHYILHYVVLLCRQRPLTTLVTALINLPLSFSPRTHTHRVLHALRHTPISLSQLSHAQEDR
jgi:hypothetical protein